MCPEDGLTDHTLAFLGEALRGRRRVLEVGCGRGTVARALAAAGFAVTAIDLALAPGLAGGTNPQFEQVDFFELAAAPFDAVVFTSSLHHISPLPRAVMRAAELLAPGGLLVVDDFDLEAPDLETLRWYYDAQELLVAAGCYDETRLDPIPSGNPNDLLARWRLAHQHEPMLHTGARMRVAISDRFIIRELRRVAYLHRYIARGVPADARGAAIASHVLAREQHRIAAGTLVPTGLRIVAERA